MGWARKQFFRAIDWVTNRLVHRTFFISRADLDYCVTHRLCHPVSVRYIGSGIDLARFQAPRDRTAVRRAVRASLGLEAETPLVLTVGRYVRAKGYGELAAAAALVRRACPGARFVWVAPVLTGEEGLAPPDLLERHGITDAVLRLGHRDDLEQLYAAADLLVHPSHREGVSRVLMEAAACELAIVASDIPGCREVVPDSRFGWLVPPHDVQALAATVAEALGNAVSRRSRAAAARARVQERFSLDRLAARIAEEYAELMQERGMAAPPR